jgi:hypothetical protein
MDGFVGKDAPFVIPACAPDFPSRPIATPFLRNASQVASQPGE